MPCRSRAQNSLYSDHPEHLLRDGLLFLVLFQFLSGVLQILHPPQFIRGILQPKVRVSVQCHPDIAMPHQVLERLGVHARLRHVAAVGMAADMGRDVRHLHPVDIVVPLDHVVEAVFPMHRYQRVAVLIHQKETAVPVDHLFNLWRPLSSIIPRKHCATSSVMGSFLVPAFVLVDSMTSRISEVRCNWWSMLMTLFSKSISRMVSPQNSEIRIPVWKRI